MAHLIGKVAASRGPFQYVQFWFSDFAEPSKYTFAPAGGLAPTFIFWPNKVEVSSANESVSIRYMSVELLMCDGLENRGIEESEN